MESGLFKFIYLDNLYRKDFKLENIKSKRCYEWKTEDILADHLSRRSPKSVTFDNFTVFLKFVFIIYFILFFLFLREIQIGSYNSISTFIVFKFED